MDCGIIEKNVRDVYTFWRLYEKDIDCNRYAK